MNKQKKILKVPLIISICVLFIGSLFKIMHWPYSDAIILLSWSAIVILYFFRFLEKKEKTALDYAKLFLVFCWSLSSVFLVFHWPYGFVFRKVFFVSGIIWFILESVRFFRVEKEEDRISSNTVLSNTLFGIAMVGVIVGAMFKILHWPFAHQLLIGGLGFGVIWVLKDIFFNKK